MPASPQALLDGVTVLDFSQFLAGPLAALRLCDLGARVVKIERPGAGDLCRTLYLSDTEIGGESTDASLVLSATDGDNCNVTKS